MITNDVFINKLTNLSLKKFDKLYPFLGEGIARRVYALNNNLIVKVAKNNDGYFQNFVEEYVYANADTRILKYLCPIYYSNSRIIIMPRAITYDKYSLGDKVNLKFLRPELSAKSDIDYMIKKFFLFEEDIYSPSSWGKIFNYNVLIDFGCTSDSGDNFYDFVYTLYFLRNKNTNNSNIFFK
ncbi:hypothetical protein SAMN02745163_03000 [Clostridium cavendishii DSM 21758]|uniref:Uncharacterized protein n=1 Tax=Clostridium cavendishii DSM 21758 TaxID=1121302 RepID=A0A1M6NSC7_9CLOT|nr:hypothetical protein [Clostridium cavendishii]SHJ98623.1 hypothetical protein SAMN02745163_03000 [Clostridium cavendishii DSM 21758]